MIISPYDTKACKGYTPSLSKIEHEVAKAIAGYSGVRFLETGSTSDLQCLELLPTVSTQVKPFGHPIQVKQIGGNAEYLVADTRTMYSVDATGGCLPKVALSASLQWTLIRLQLQAIWQTPNYPLLQTMLDYPMMLYGKVFSEAIARKYGIDPSVIARVDMLMSYAFWCFSHTDDQYENFSKDELAHLIATTIKSTTDDISSVISNLDFIYSLDDVVAALQDEQIIGTKRCANISVGVLFEIARSTWYISTTAPAAEIASVSLEHPITWMANVYLSLANTQFKNHISTVAQRYKRTLNSDPFMMGIVHLLGDK